MSKSNNVKNTHNDNIINATINDSDSANDTMIDNNISAAIINIITNNVMNATSLILPESENDKDNDNIGGSDDDNEPIEANTKIIIDNKSEFDEKDTDIDNTKIFKFSKLLTDYDPIIEAKKDSEEEILKESNFRLAIKPIDKKYQIFWDLYKKQMDAFWTASEIDFSNDRYDFEKLSRPFKHFIKRNLAFFAGSDTIVVLNIKEKFRKITVREIDIPYSFQLMMENIHGEVYADMLLNIVKSVKEQRRLINAYKNIESIRIMMDWAQKWSKSNRSIGYIVFAFVIFEGLMFSGAFVSIYWLKKILGDDKMKGLVQSNNLIARDEGMHTNFGCLVYYDIKHRLTDEEAIMMMKEGVDIAKMFTKDAIRIDMLGMNIELMNEYLEYVADRLMIYLGYQKIYGTKIPDAFKFMETIGFLNKDNFFERRTTDYQRSYNSKHTAEWKFRTLSVY